jgi:hypothetical protein
MKKYLERGVLEKRWIDEWCKGNWEKCIRYKMAENGEYHPDWMLPDGSINDQLFDDPGRTRATR